MLVTSYLRTLPQRLARCWCALTSHRMHGLIEQRGLVVDGQRILEEHATLLEVCTRCGDTRPYRPKRQEIGGKPHVRLIRGGKR